MGAAPARRTRWVDTTVFVSVVSATQFVQSLDVQVVMRNATLTRMLLCFTVLPTAPGLAGTESMLVSIAVGLGSVEAVTASPAVIPDPNVDAEQPTLPWVWKCRYWVQEPMGNDISPIFVDKDIHAQRKIGDGRLYMAINNDPGAGVAPFSVRVVGLVRCLVLLP